MSIDRDIKFRAWDKEENKIYPDFHKTYMFADALNDDDSGYIVMQYTGLKDKDGKEIYEGDIVGIKDKKGDVFWWDEEACWGINYDNKQYYLIGHVSDWFLHNIEVIGNIWENPELTGK